TTVKGEGMTPPTPARQQRSRLSVLLALVAYLVGLLCAPQPLAGDQSLLGLAVHYVAKQPGNDDTGGDAVARAVAAACASVAPRDRQFRAPAVTPGLGSTVTALTFAAAILYWLARTLDRGPAGPTAVERILGALFPLALAAESFVSPATALALGVV